MNNIRKSVVGIDVVIQEIQTQLYNDLVTLWDDNISAYGRIYKNIDSNGEFLPNFHLINNDYKEVYHKDKDACTLFFIESDEHKSEDEIVFVSQVKCAFMVNLVKVYPDNKDRSDTDAQRDVVEILRKYSYSRYNIKGIDKTIKRVFSGLKTEGIKFLDIHPYHCFSVNIDLSYYLTDKCS